MNFPMYDISELSWNKYRIKEHNVLYDNPYLGIVPKNGEEFAKRVKGFKYVSPDGELFKVVGYKILPRKSPIRFPSLRRKIEFEFVQIDEQYTFEMFKELIISRAKETGNEGLEKLAKDAGSFRDILHFI